MLVVRAALVQPRFAIRAFHALIMGPPGGGKGTLSKRIEHDFGFKVLSAGDVLRAQNHDGLLMRVAAGTAIGKTVQGTLAAGKLVPAELIVELMFVEMASLPKDAPVLLDGFPRSLQQARLVDQRLKFDAVLNVDVPFETIVQRLAARLCHLPSGRIYNTEYKPPKREGLDDVTGEALVVRDDDKPETVRHRLATYQAQTLPLIQHYSASHVLATFTGTESNVIYPHIYAFLKDTCKVPLLTLAKGG